MAVAPNAKGRFPVEAKTQSAGLGAGFGVALAGAIVGVLQQYVTHDTLPLALTDLIYLGSGAAVAWAAAYFAPHQDRR